MSENQDIPEQDESELLALRRAKLTEMREQGNAFPNDFRRDSLARDLQDSYGEKTKEVLENEGVPVKVAGRIMLRRIMGKASFAPALSDFYLSNPIARASELMAELSSNAAARRANPMAAE